MALRARFNFTRVLSRGEEVLSILSQHFYVRGGRLVLYQSIMNFLMYPSFTDLYERLITMPIRRSFETEKLCEQSDCRSFVYYATLYANVETTSYEYTNRNGNEAETCLHHYKCLMVF